METTRQSILAYIESKQTATSGEISRALKTTPANARRHLSLLKDEGVVIVIGNLPARRRGRPTLVYALGKNARQHNLDGLASALLDEILDDAQPETLPDTLQQLAVRLIGKSLPLPSSLPQRLYQTVQVLNKMEYRARWEAHATAPRIILGHCPYAAILADHPELCQLDSYIIESLLDIPARQIEKLVKDHRGTTYCKFITGGKPPYRS